MKNKTKGNGTFKIIICGGRHFDDYEYLKASCDSVISQIGTDKGIEIVSGHCKGCDMLGEKYGIVVTENGYREYDESEQQAVFGLNKTQANQLITAA